MDRELRVRTTVLPGGKIEIVTPELPSGEPVEVIVLPLGKHRLKRRSAVDILAAAPGHRLFKTVDDVDTYIQAERDSWDP